MAITYSPISSLKPKICKKRCKLCGLDIYQKPAYDHLKSSNIFWVGLSAVQFNEGMKNIPLSHETRTGSLIHTIEQPFLKRHSFYKTNLVKCVPLQEDKIRYPLEHEMEKCFPNFEWELEKLTPSTVILLGKQVSDFVFKKLFQPKPQLNAEYNYSSYQIGGINFVPVHHPSYILVYRRKHLEQYITNIQHFFPRKISKKSLEDRF